MSMYMYVYLMNEHEDNGSVTPRVLGHERERVGVVEECVSEGPVNGGS